MARYGKDRGGRSISISAAIPKTSPKENSGTTPANSGSATGPGDEFVVVGAYESGCKLPSNLTWDYSMSGGTLTAFTITLEGSTDGVSWYTLDTGTVTTTAGESRNVSGLSYQMYRLNITVRTVNTGTPVTTGTISL